MERPSNIVRVRKNEKLPMARSTIYKMHSMRRFPRLIFIIPGAGLCFDLDEWHSMCEAAREANVKSATRIHRVLGK